jgi:hypothetical protein
MRAARRYTALQKRYLRLKGLFGRSYLPGHRPIDELLRKQDRPTVPAPRMTMRQVVDAARRERELEEASLWAPESRV